MIHVIETAKLYFNDQIPKLFFWELLKKSCVKYVELQDEYVKNHICFMVFQGQEHIILQVSTIITIVSSLTITIKTVSSILSRNAVVISSTI